LNISLVVHSTNVLRVLKYGWIQIFTMIKDPPLVVFFIGIIFSMVFFSTTNSFFNQKVYGHIFSPDETASFVAFADQLQVESELVQANLANNNLSLAQEHATKAAALLTPTIMIEIAEENQGIADDLTTAVNDLRKISSPSSEKQRQMVNQLVSDINASLSEAVTIRIKQAQGEDSSNFLEKGIDFLRGIFGGGDEKGDDKRDKDTTTQPLAFADLVDSVLINYGNAYGVGFDMTNMSNMIMMESNNNSSSMAMSGMVDDNNSSNMNMGSMNTSSSTMMNMDSEMKRNYSLVNTADYQSTQALAAKALEIFNTELRPMASNNNNNNNTTAFITNLENGLTQLNNSIRSKASPMDIMMIVHTQVHPNLMQAFNLQLR
jgi:hypothetical protein